MIPAWGIWVRHARNVTFDRIDLRTAEPDFRPPLTLDDVEGATLLHVRSPAEPGRPMLRARQVRGLAIESSPGLSDTNRVDLIADETF